MEYLNMDLKIIQTNMNADFPNLIKKDSLYLDLKYSYEDLFLVHDIQSNYSQVNFVKTALEYWDAKVLGGDLKTIYSKVGEEIEKYRTTNTMKNIK